MEDGSALFQQGGSSAFYAYDSAKVDLGFITYFDNARDSCAQWYSRAG